MEHLCQPTQRQITLSFAASCVESVARRLGVDYLEVFNRMKKVDLFGKLIFPHYDTLHTESREVVTDRLIETLTRWEEQL